MKSFLIKKPAPGRTSCAMVHQFYDKESRRTKTIYLGSFNLSLDPDAVPDGLNLRPHKNLTPGQLDEVRSFLRECGTFGKPPVIPDEVMREAMRQIDLQRMRERRGLRNPELRDAIEALVEAADYVESEAVRLMANRVKLSKGLLASNTTEDELCSNALDRLKVDANRVRSAFQRFESSLRGAGLVRKRSRGS